MWSGLAAPLLFGLIAAGVTCLGLLAVAWKSEWSARYSGLFALAAGGMLVTLTLLHIAPEALAGGEAAASLVLGGFLAALVLNNLVRWMTPLEGRSTHPSEALTPLLAIGTHSFVDGIVYSVTFSQSFASGLYAALGLILHEFPEGVIAYAILRRHGVSNMASFGWAFAAAAATTPAGVLASGPMLAVLGPEAIAPLFALSAGLLLYVATGPLMAPLKELRAPAALPALAIGVSLALVVIALPLHSHGGHGHAHGPHDHHHGHTHDHGPLSHPID